MKCPACNYEHSYDVETETETEIGDEKFKNLNIKGTYEDNSSYYYSRNKVVSLLMCPKCNCIVGSEY